jgi:LysM repeat protein
MNENDIYPPDKREGQLVKQLRAVASATRPRPEFATQLETDLLARWKSVSSAPVAPRGAINPANLGRQPMFKRLSFVLAGAAALALLTLLGLPLLNSRQDLPPLPSLAVLSAYAQGDARTEVAAIFPGTEFVLNTTLPSAPDRVSVFQQPEPEPLTIEDARRLAERFGVEGQVYVRLRQSPMHAVGDVSPGVADGGMGVSVSVPLPAGPAVQAPTAYTVFDGPRQVTVRGAGVFYTDESVQTTVGTTATAMAALSFEQAAAIAEDFLRARGLLDFPYRAEPDQEALGNVVRFVQLADGRPVRNADVRVTVAPDGRVAAVSHPLLTLEPAGEYPIRSVQDTWDALRSGQPGGETQYTISREAPDPAASPFKSWGPQYRPGQRADLYGSPVSFLPVEGDGSPLVEMNGLWLRGDVQALSEQQEVVQHVWGQGEPHYMGQMNVWGILHVWGQVRQDVPGVLALDVAGWEVASQPLPQSFHGTIGMKDDLVLLLREDGKTLVLPNPPGDLTDGLAVSVYGWETERTSGGYPVLDWQVLQTPPGTGTGGPHIATTTWGTAVQVEEAPVTPTMPTHQASLPFTPVPDTHAAATPTLRTTVAGQPASPRPITHTVRAGETLQGIAWQYGVMAEAILRANDLAGPERFQVGQVLVIPTSSEMMEGTAGGGDATLALPVPTPTAPPGGRTGISGGGYSPSPVLPTPPLEPGQQVEGLEGQLSATIYESADGESRTLRQGSGQALQVTLAEMPLDPDPGWEVRLSGLELADVEPYNRLRVRVWGRYVVEGDEPAIEVERYETAYPDQRVRAWLGTVEIVAVEGREVALFQSREGERYVLASSLRYPNMDWYRQTMGDHQVVQEGVVRPETFGGYLVIEEFGSHWGSDVDRMTELEDHQQVTGVPVEVVGPPEPPLPGKAFVEQVELVYYAVPIANVAYASGFSPDPSLRVAQPVWRFAGHTGDGATFEILVQAVRDEYLK